MLANKFWAGDLTEFSLSLKSDLLSFISTVMLVIGGRFLTSSLLITVTVVVVDDMLGVLLQFVSY
jgi:hypothetical protein